MFAASPPGVNEILADLQTRGVVLRADGDKLTGRAPRRDRGGDAVRSRAGPALPREAPPARRARAPAARDGAPHRLRRPLHRAAPPRARSDLRRVRRRAALAAPRAADAVRGLPGA